MPISADTLALLMQKGIFGDDLVEVVRAIDADGADAQPVRSLRQDRNARYYQKRKQREASETVLNKTSEQDGKGVAASPKEKTQTPTTTPKIDSQRGDARSILGSVLSDDTVVDLMAHRKAKRSPITPGAAKGLARAFTEYGDPEGAARAMMANGWTGFKAEWMSSRQARAGPSRNGRPRTLAEMARMDEPDEPDTFDGTGSHHAPDARHGAPEGPGADDASREGFAGRLSVKASSDARRGALIDH